MKLQMLSGIPGSGKTTEARKIVAESGSAGRINRDDLRPMLFDGKWSGPREKIVVECEKAIAQVLAEYGCTPLIDDTNLTPGHRDMWAGFCKSNGLEFTVQTIQTPYEECLRRNAARSNPVPEPVITRMAIQSGAIKLNQEIAIFDIDGTIADGRHREHFAVGSVKNWPAYYSLLADDEPIELVCRWMNAEYDSGNRTILLVSGRPDTYWRETVAWLAKHDLRYHYLLMRGGSDRRDDTVVKKQILALLPKERIVFVADDRPRVIRMWRENGLRVVPVRGQCEEF